MKNKHTIDPHCKQCIYDNGFNGCWSRKGESDYLGSKCDYRIDPMKKQINY
jgi:hypothetical protein